MLDAEWITWRLAYELTGEWYGGGQLNNLAYGVSADLLAAHVPPRGTVIDLGCGIGRLAALLPPDVTYIGLDQNRDRLAHAQREFAARPAVRFQYYDATTPWPDGVVGDTVLLVGVLEHVESPETLLRQLRAVAPTLIVEVPDVEADPLNWARQQVGCRWYSDDDHVREYTKALLADQLTRSGWTPNLWVQRGLMVTAVCQATDPRQ